MIELRTLGALELRGTEGQQLLSVLTQPRRLAVLAYLAIARPHGFHRRDSLLALFWPELDSHHARDALSQALRYLRRSLGEEAVIGRGSEEVGLDAGRVRCDVPAFEAALAQGRNADALELYRGDLLKGFSISDAPEFERWLEAERARVRELAAGAAWALAGSAEAEGNLAGAGHWARRAAELAPYDEHAHRRLLELLARAGDRSGAVREHEAFRRRLREELELEPAPETRALVDAIRARDGPADDSPAWSRTDAPPAALGAGPAAAPGAPRAARLRRPFVRRPARVGAAAALGALVVTAAGYGLVKNLGAADSLVSRGLLHERQPILVAEFDNHTRDSLLGRAVTEALRVDLAQSATVTLLQPEALQATLARMDRPASSPLLLPLAQEIAVREGIPVVVSGNVASAGSGFVLSAQLLAAGSGQTLAAHRETAADPSGVIRAIDRLSAKLRREIGDSRDQIHAEKPLAHVTTASLEALKKYSQSREAFLEGDLPRTIALLDDAIREDTAFAMAYRSLGIHLAHVGERHRIRTVLTRAFELSDRLPDSEKYHVRGTYHTAVSFSPGEAITAYRMALRHVPDDGRAALNLGVIHWNLRQYADAETLFVRVLRANPAGVHSYVNLISVQLQQGRLEEARLTQRRFATTQPRNPYVLHTDPRLAYFEGDYDGARAGLEQMRSEWAADAVWGPRTSLDLARVAATQGRIAEARAHAERAFALWERTRPNTVEYLRAAIELATWEATYAGDAASALARVGALLPRFPLDSIHGHTYAYLKLAELYALVGEPHKARRIVARVERDMNAAALAAHENVLLGTRGSLALAAGRPDAAIAAFRQADAAAWHGVCAEIVCFLPSLGRAHEMAGRPDSAVAAYHRYLGTFFGRWELDGRHLAEVHERLARLYERRGDRARAVAHYQRFVDLWRTADSELQPRVRQARTRLARLTATPTR